MCFSFSIEDVISMAEGLSGSKFKEIASQGLSAIYEAGLFIRGRYGKPHDIEFKGAIDLVTETDLGSERILKKRLGGIGNAEIMAEESSLDNTLRNGIFWIIDPLDGTTNFAHGFPFFAPSVAYCQVDSGHFQSIFGCIFVPCLGELFWAIKGKGSYLNTRAVKVSPETRLSRSLLATGFPYDVHEHPDQVVSALRQMLVRAQGIRRAGAAAIDLAYVACGRFDGFWEKKLKPWDTAAGQLILEEAGGRLTDFKGNSYNPFIPEIVASNGLIHHEMLDILREF